MIEEPRNLTVYQAARALRQGRLTAEGLLRSCLARIEAREGQVRAWVSLHADEALATARAQDREARRGRWAGPLHGIPVGVKDIFHVRGMETRAGAEVYGAPVADADADAVARLRSAGALLLGKTVTTAFAYADVRETRNPWDLSRTPGGSSSGSGAAVGDRMCLAALGTQTGGSTLRPGAFNGIPAFKPTLGEISTAGVLELSWTLDHVGLLAREVADLALLWRVTRQAPFRAGRGAADALPPAPPRSAPGRLWRVRGEFESECQPECLDELERVCRLLRREGVRIVEHPLPPSFAGIHDAWHCIMFTEATLHHREPFAARERDYPPRMAGLLREGLEIRGVDYVAALRQRERFRRESAAILAGVDGAILPVTPTPPPDPTTTGDAVFLRPWTLGGFPTLALPSGVTDAGLPLAVQLVGGWGTDASLLRTGRWCERRLGFHRFPA